MHLHNDTPLYQARSRKPASWSECCRRANTLGAPSRHRTHKLASGAVGIAAAFACSLLWSSFRVRCHNRISHPTTSIWKADIPDNVLIFTQGLTHIARLLCLMPCGAGTIPGSFECDLGGSACQLGLQLTLTCVTRFVMVIVAVYPPFRQQSEIGASARRCSVTLWWWSSNASLSERRA